MYEDLRKEIQSLLSKGTRLDGRKADQYRNVTVELGVSKNAEGSARVKIGDTEVLAGVKMEIMKPYPDAKDVGSLMVNVELSPLASPNFETGPPSMQSIELARITDRAIRESKAIDVHKLCIEEGEKAWMVVIDVCPINDAGNLYDAVALAAMAAVKNAVFPGYENDTLDYKNKSTEKLPVSKTPVSVTVYKYGQQLVLDPTDTEEKVYDARLTIAVLENDNLCSLQKGGDAALTQDEFFKMVDLAIAKSKELRDKIPAQ